MERIGGIDSSILARLHERYCLLHSSELQGRSSKFVLTLWWSIMCKPGAVCLEERERLPECRIGQLGRQKVGQICGLL